jgi:hypothetical protein
MGYRRDRPRYLRDCRDPSGRAGADIPVLTAKRFSNPGEIVARFSQAPNITPVDFDGNPPSRRWSAMAKVAILPA